MNALDELNRLTSEFSRTEELFSEAQHVPKAQTPGPYARMLVHDKHMTVTMESWHGCSVDVDVLDEKLNGSVYTRKILLRRSDNRRPVQFGIVRFDFSYVDDQVRSEILAGNTPLGRILIEHNVLRQVDLGAILRITAGPGLARALEIPEGETTYGRLATIFCNGQPAVDLLEVSAPLE